MLGFAIGAGLGLLKHQQELERAKNQGDVDALQAVPRSMLKQAPLETKVPTSSWIDQVGQGALAGAAQQQNWEASTADAANKERYGKYLEAETNKINAGLPKPEEVADNGDRFIGPGQRKPTLFNYDDRPTMFKSSWSVA